MDHSVVFSGRLRSGMPAEEVRSNLARLFRLEPGPKLDRLFTGQPVVLKKGLDAEAARHYADTLLRAGAICEVRRNADAAAPAPALAPQQPASTEAAPVAATSWANLTLAPVESREPPAAEQVPVAPRDTTTTLTPAVSPYAVSASSRREEIARAFADHNSSGSGSSAHLPEEARGLSWGGFLLTFIWGLGNRTYIALLCLLPVIGFFVAIYLLFKGREMAWQNKRWESVEHFNKIQRRWGIAGLVILILLVWGGYSTSRFEDRIAAENNSTEIKRQRQEVLDKIDDAETRRQMEQFYEQMDRQSR